MTPKIALTTIDAATKRPATSGGTADAVGARRAQEMRNNHRDHTQDLQRQTRREHHQTHADRGGRHGEDPPYLTGRKIGG